MDEQLLKRSVQSIEMPEDMKDRIIENCRSGEAKPLFTPKKRLVYMPMAVTACVCVLVAALAGVGIWQMKTLSEGGSPTEGTHDIGTQEDVINVIPISDEDLDTIVPAYKSGYSAPAEDIDNLATMTEEEINEYYGIDTAYLLSGLNIKLTPIDPAEVDGIVGPYVFRTDGGWGETYYDTNAFTYGEEGEICVYISKFAVPYSIPKLWSDKEQLSTISGVTAAVGRREDGDWQKYNGGKYQYRVEFERKLENDTLYFNVWCDYDMISSVVRAIKFRCDSSYAAGVPVDITDATGGDVSDCMDIINQNSDFTAIDGVVYDIDFDGIDEVLVLADVPFRAICVFEKENGKMVQTDTFGMGSLSYVETLTLHTYSDDNEKYPFFIFHYDNGGAMKCDVVAAIKPADGSYNVEYLLSFGTLTYADIPEPFTKEFYRIGWNKTDIAMDGDYNDISKEEFLELYAKYKVKEPLTLDKLKEICSGDTSKLTWSDFEQFESTGMGSGLYILCYNIEDKYILFIGGGAPDSEPYYMRFRVIGQYYDIDIREESLEEYLNQPIPEGDFINVIPITWKDIENGRYTADKEFAEGDQIYLTDKQLTEYYGIDITSFGGMPEGFRATEDVGQRYVLVDWDGGGTVYYDINGFNYTSPYRTGMITVSVGTLPGHIDKLGEDKKMCSRIGDRFVTIGQTEDGHYEVEILSADNVLGIGISADGVTLEELCKIIAALVEKTEVRDCVNEAHPYPWDYIDALMNAADVPAAYGSLIWPTDGGCIGEWGHWDGGYYGHTGIDISGIETGAPVYAGADGVVAYAGWKADLGYYVEIYHPDLGITSCYAHNSVIYVSEGQQVTQGERIAGAGSTGVAYGTCVHIAVKVNGENVNPRKYLSHIPEGDPYGGKDKETYQDPAEFVFGIQHIIQESATVEKMYKALAEFDTEGRIDRVVLSFDGKPVTDGRIVQGLYCEVYYDNEASWFSFNI